jgi:hypothetical protein
VGGYLSDPPSPVSRRSWGHVPPSTTAPLPLRSRATVEQRPVELLAAIWNESWGRWDHPSELGRSVAVHGRDCAATADGVVCSDYMLGNNDRHYLRGTQIGRVAEAPDGSLWAVGGYEGEGGGLYRISLE